MCANAIFSEGSDDDSDAPTVLAIPASISRAAIAIKLNETTVKALLDTGASDNFVNFSIAKKLRLQWFGKRHSVKLADKGRKTIVHGTVYVTLEITDRKYIRVKFGVIENLCADVVLGQEFMKRHSQINFMLGVQCDLLW